MTLVIIIFFSNLIVLDLIGQFRVFSSHFFLFYAIYFIMYKVNDISHYYFFKNFIVLDLIGQFRVF